MAALTPANLGRKAEDVVCRHLEMLGWEVLGRNVRTPAGELDIVAREGQTIVFVEVKARRSGSMGGAEEAVDGRKRRRLVAAAEAFLAANPLQGECRFDVAAVEVGSGDIMKVRLVRDAFRGWE